MSEGSYSLGCRSCGRPLDTGMVCRNPDCPETEGEGVRFPRTAVAEMIAEGERQRTADERRKLRDHLAAAAMNGFLASRTTSTVEDLADAGSEIAALSYALADMMLLARELGE